MQCKIIGNGPKMDNCQKVFRDVLKSCPECPKSFQRDSEECPGILGEFQENVQGVGIFGAWVTGP